MATPVMSFGRQGRALGNEAGRERHFRKAHRLYTEMGAAGHAERVGREVGV